jgi:hypothetical protein
MLMPEIEETDTGIFLHFAGTGQNLGIRTDDPATPAFKVQGLASREPQIRS